MKKVGKIFWYVFGSFLAFILNLTGASAQLDSTTISLYGVEQRPLPETVATKILSPVIIIIIAVLAFIVGLIIFIIKRSKRVKKDSNL